MMTKQLRWQDFEKNDDDSGAILKQNILNRSDQVTGNKITRDRHREISSIGESSNKTGLSKPNLTSPK